MNLYESHPIRDRYGIDMLDEYLLGLLACHGVMLVTETLNIATEAMAYATAHKRINRLTDKGFIAQARAPRDKRRVELTLTALALGFINELRS